MPSTAQTNARLLAIADSAAAGGTDNYDGPPAPPVPPPAARWSGVSGCWYEEKVDRRTTPAGSSRETLRSMIVTDQLRDGAMRRVTVDQGDVLTFERDGQTYTGTVQEAVHKPAPGSAAGEFRLLLELA